MELHTISRNEMKPNPELELIRNKVLLESAINNTEWIRELIRRTSRIHAGFLFEERKALQNLCLFIGETQNKLTDAGWEAFGYRLGLNPCVLKVINHNNFNKEDPTYNILLAFVQFDNATVGKLVQALWDIGRLDVISRIRKSLSDLADIVLQHTQNNFNISSEENSDYGSLQLSNERNLVSGGSDSDILEDNIGNNGNLNMQTYNVIRPVMIPPAPFIFQNIKATQECTSHLIQQCINSRNSLSDYQSNGNISDCCVQSKILENAVTPYTLESVQTSAADSQKKVTNTMKRYGKTVMLTFASDGEKYAKEICKILRRDRGKYPKIGVLVLSEHAKEVMKDPQRFIIGVFHQVDYICPILTESYFNVIRRKEKSPIQSDLHLDARYVQFIHALMNNYYVSNGCLNDKIRCIIPDEIMSKVRCNLLMSVPTFSAWVRLSEVDEMAVRLLKSKV